MKRILKISVMVLLVMGTLFLLSFADQKHQVNRYQSFSISILNASEHDLISEKEIRDIVTERFGKIEGTMITLINLNELETMIRNNPYVATCEVYQTISGELNMIVTVRSPLVRVMNDSGQQYYIDQMGYIVPVTFAHPSHVPIASGNISDRYVMIGQGERALASLPDSSVLRQIYPVALVISRDDFLKSFIDQIFINDQKEIELVPKMGKQQILFGSSENARQKLDNLKAFYTKIMNKMDWNTYKIINIKYNNQVVCSK